MHHLIGFGTLVAFIDYAQRFFTPLRDVSSKYTTLQSALASVERIEALMETRATIASPPMPSRITDGPGAIAFDHVSFEYRRGSPVLRHLSFRVDPGQKIAILGPTRSPTTTIINVLTALYDVTSGRILVDGVDLPGWELKKLN